jgi:hypothetical protein
VELPHECVQVQGDLNESKLEHVLTVHLDPQRLPSVSIGTVTIL